MKSWTVGGARAIEFCDTELIVKLVWFQASFSVTVTAA